MNISDVMFLKAALIDVPRPAPFCSSIRLQKGASKAWVLIINKSKWSVQKYMEDFMDTLGSVAHHC